MDPVQSAQSKICDLQKITKDFEPMRGQYPLVTTNGCFDLLHAGHIRSFAFAAEQSPYVVVLVNSDASVQKLKGAGRPIQPTQDRALIIASIQFVWRVCIFNEDTPVNALQILKPNIHLKGEEYKDQTIPEQAVLQSYGGKMVYVPTYKGLSTSAIIDRIKSL